MATATESKPAKTLKSFAVICPHCMNADEPQVTLDMNDLAEFHCGSCDETFTAQEALEMFAEQAARWEKVARFLALAAEA